MHFLLPLYHTGQPCLSVSCTELVVQSMVQQSKSFFNDTILGASSHELVFFSCPLIINGEEGLSDYFCFQLLHLPTAGFKGRKKNPSKMLACF